MSLATIGVVAGVAADIGRSALQKPFDWLLALFAAIVLVTHTATLLEVMALAALCGAVFMRPHENLSGSTRGRLNKIIISSRSIAASVSSNTFGFAIGRITCRICADWNRNVRWGFCNDTCYRA